MDDLGRPDAREERGHPGAVGDVEALEGEVRMRAQAFEPRFLQRHVVVIVEVVDSDHAVAAIEETARRVVPDETRRAGEKDHRIVHCACAGRALDTNRRTVATRGRLTFRARIAILFRICLSLVKTSPIPIGPSIPFRSVTSSTR